MKVLWVCNIMLPVIAEALHKEASNKECSSSPMEKQVHLCYTRFTGF